MLRQLLIAMLLLPSFAHGAEYLIVGIDSKTDIRREGMVKLEPGTDRVMIYNIAETPDAPKLVADVPVSNSVFGPPTNLGFTPDASLAIVASSVSWVKNGEVWESVPDTRLNLIDMRGPKPELFGTLEVGKQPSGIAISRDGKWMGVANRNGRSVSLISISAGASPPHPTDSLTVAHHDTVEIEGEAAAVAITPDSKRMLVTKFGEHAVAVLDIEEGKLKYDPKNDLTVGRWPYNVQITPAGDMALVANNGMNGLPDGHVDTVSVVDMQADPPRVVDHVVVGDGPEGLAISPDGKLALVPILQGSAPWFEETWFHNDNGKVVVLSIDGLNVKKVGEVPVGRFPEGVGFSQDGKWAYVGDLLDDRVTILKIDGQTVTDSGRSIKLPGHPASLRTQLP